MTDDTDHLDPDFELEPSKSQLKRESQALQELGDRLTGFSDDQLAELPLSDPLREAIKSARNMRANSARKRQVQYIGKLLRQGDTEGILEALEQQDAKANVVHQMHELCDHWRQRLLSEDDALADFLTQYPQADRQQLRQLLRNCHKASDPQAQKAQSRKLLNWVKETWQLHQV